MLAWFGATSDKIQFKQEYGEWNKCIDSCHLYTKRYSWIQVKLCSESFSWKISTQYSLFDFILHVGSPPEKQDNTENKASTLSNLVAAPNAHLNTATEVYFGIDFLKAYFSMEEM